MSNVVLFGPIVRDLDASWVQKLVLRIGFAGPWRVGFWMTYWNSLFPTSKPEDHQGAKEALARNLREPGRMAALKAMIGLSKADTAAILSVTSVPVLVVMGSRDPDFADASEEARSLAATLGAKTLIVDGAGHYPHTEMPDRVAPDLLAFVRNL